MAPDGISWIVCTRVCGTRGPGSWSCGAVGFAVVVLGVVVFADVALGIVAWVVAEC